MLAADPVDDILYKGGIYRCQRPHLRLVSQLDLTVAYQSLVHLLCRYFGPTFITSIVLVLPAADFSFLLEATHTTVFIHSYKLLKHYCSGIDCVLIVASDNKGHKRYATLLLSFFVGSDSMKARKPEVTTNK